MPAITIKGYIFAVAVGALLMLSGWLYIENASLQNKVKTYETAKAESAGAARQAAHEANSTIVRIQEKIVYREKQSEPIYKYIETYKGDTNASDCDNNMSLLRSFSF